MKKGNSIYIACITDAWDSSEAIRRIKAGAYEHNINIDNMLCLLSPKMSVNRIKKICKEQKINIY